jgi:hypothetical protein
MDNFKFLRGKEESIFRLIENFQPITFNQPRFQNEVEFCFQFNDDEPISFATGSNDLHIHVSPTPNGNISFTNNGQTFKIFAREVNETV